MSGGHSIAIDREASAKVDVVVVSYNSRDELRGCVAPLAEDPELAVVVVDNASRDRSLDAVSDLPVTPVSLPRNVGFAEGCNRGWRHGAAPFVLFLNPDARIAPAAIESLVAALEAHGTAAAVAPRVVNGEGELDYSLRRFPRLRSTYAQALFLHRLFPRAAWTDELIREPERYDTPGPVDWASGVCLLVRRDVLQALGGWDAGFFMYCEDIDLCRRIRDAGYEVRYVPGAAVEHRGGASAPRSTMLPILAASRVRYARKHSSLPTRMLERFGILLGALTHMLVGQGRAGHARAGAVAAGLLRPTGP